MKPTFVEASSTSFLAKAFYRFLLISIVPPIFFVNFRSAIYRDFDKTSLFPARPRPKLVSTLLIRDEKLARDCLISISIDDRKNNVNAPAPITALRLDFRSNDRVDTNRSINCSRSFF